MDKACSGRNILCKRKIPCHKLNSSYVSFHRTRIKLKRMSGHSYLMNLKNKNLMITSWLFIPMSKKRYKSTTPSLTLKWELRVIIMVGPTFMWVGEYLSRIIYEHFSAADINSTPSYISNDVINTTTSKETSILEWIYGLCMSNNDTSLKIRKKDDAEGWLLVSLTQDALGQELNCTMHLQPTRYLPLHAYQRKRFITRGIPWWDYPCTMNTLGCTEQD